MSHYVCSDPDFYFVSPIDGDCLNIADAETSDPFTVRVRIHASENAHITINGATAKKDPVCGLFSLSVPLCGWENVLVARDENTGREIRITLFRLCTREKSYRLSSDDNILFLQNIHEHRDTYRSIFEDPYLAVYKKAHDLYGAKVHLNLFYELDEQAASHFARPRAAFNLSMMTDRFKDEFSANADWLKLAFHARSEFPDKPYRHARAEQIMRDAERVNREILRFAGKASLPNTTTIHWGEASPECVRALRALGYQSLTGYFEHTMAGEPLVAYFYPDDLIDHVGERDFWYDREQDMFYGRIDLVLNCNTHAENMESIRAIMSHAGRGNFVSVMIHEQYFYEDYTAYLPDFETRVLDVCRLLAENGYRGSHIDTVLREPDLSERL